MVRSGELRRPTRHQRRPQREKRAVLEFLDQTVYVQIEKDAFSVLHVQTNQKFHLQSPVPFSAQLAVGQLKPAVDILKKFLAEVYLPESLFRTSPVVVVHQVY